MKQVIIDAVVGKLESELKRQVQANVNSNASTAFSAANAEKQRDTTGFESAFLARGYAKHCMDLSHRLELLRTLVAEDFSGQEVDVGALVKVEMEGEVAWYLLLECGGGIDVSVEGRSVTVVTPDSPMGKALLGNVEAGFVGLPSGMSGIILSVC